MKKVAKNFLALCVISASGCAWMFRPSNEEIAMHTAPVIKCPRADTSVANVEYGNAATFDAYCGDRKFECSGSYNTIICNRVVSQAAPRRKK